MDAHKRSALDALKQAVIDGNPPVADELAKKVLGEGVDPIDAAKEMSEAIQQVGQQFGEGNLFLPELVASGAAMQAAMRHIQAEIATRGQSFAAKGRMVIGTVLGDVHDIGKNMVATLVQSAGFEVIDLGVNIDADSFVAAVKKHRPDILALSALMTTTLMEQKKVISRLEAEGLRDKVKVIVGGAAVTKDFADRIGADGYESTAPRAAELALRIINGRRAEGLA